MSRLVHLRHPTLLWDVQHCRDPNGKVMGMNVYVCVKRDGLTAEDAAAGNDEAAYGTDATKAAVRALRREAAKPAISRQEEYHRGRRPAGWARAVGLVPVSGDEEGARVGGAVQLARVRDAPVFLPPAEEGEDDHEGDEAADADPDAFVLTYDEAPDRGDAPFLAVKAYYDQVLREARGAAASASAANDELVVVAEAAAATGTGHDQEAGVVVVGGSPPPASSGLPLLRSAPSGGGGGG